MDHAKGKVMVWCFLTFYLVATKAKESQNSTSTTKWGMLTSNYNWLEDAPEHK